MIKVDAVSVLVVVSNVEVVVGVVVVVWWLLAIRDVDQLIDPFRSFRVSDRFVVVAG